SLLPIRLPLRQYPPHVLPHFSPALPGREEQEAPARQQRDQLDAHEQVIQAGALLPANPRPVLLPELAFGNLPDEHNGQDYQQQQEGPSPAHDGSRLGGQVKSPAGCPFADTMPRSVVSPPVREP